MRKTLLILIAAALVGVFLADNASTANAGQLLIVVAAVGVGLVALGWRRS